MYNSCIVYNVQYATTELRAVTAEVELDILCADVAVAEVADWPHTYNFLGSYIRMEKDENDGVVTTIVIIIVIIVITNKTPTYTHIYIHIYIHI